jgi:hypothetical protein
MLVSSKIRVACVSCAALFLFGCGAAPRAKFPSADSLLEHLDAQSSCSRALTGEAKLYFNGEGRQLHGKMMFLAAAPESLRFDVTSSLGATITTLTSDGSSFGLSSLIDKTYFSGPARSCNVQKFTRVPAPPSVLVSLLRGRAPRLITGPGERTLSYERPLFGSGYYELSLGSPSRASETLRVSVHPDDFERPLKDQRLRLEYFDVSKAAERLFDVTLGGHKKGERAPLATSEEDVALGLTPTPFSGPPCSSELPTFARFYVEETAFELTFSEMDLRHNPQLSEESFTQPVPGGVVSRVSDCSDPADAPAFEREVLPEFRLPE